MATPSNVTPCHTHAVRSTLHHMLLRTKMQLNAVIRSFHERSTNNPELLLLNKFIKWPQIK